MSTHIIRLRGPWRIVRNDGITRHIRNFGRPQALDPTEHLWLTATFIPSPAEIVVNGTTVGSIAESTGDFSAEITHIINRRNELVIVTGSILPLGDIALEIRSSDPDM